MNEIRMGRIAQEIKKVLSTCIAHELNDRRISPITSITEVRVTNDLSFADIYVSVFAERWDQKQEMEALQQAEGYLKKRLAQEVKMRSIPALRFHLDTSAEHGLYMDQLIEKTMQEDRKSAIARGEDPDHPLGSDHE